jgi:addiction module HigA family antidote
MMKNPAHPGEILRELYLEPLGLTVTAAAKGLGVSRKTLSELLNGRYGISPEMAFRLAKAFGADPEFWLRLQNTYDLAQVRAHAEQLEIQTFIQPQWQPA